MTEYKVGVVSLGCSKNLVDTEEMLGYLKSLGFVFTPVAEEADALIVNTCGFIEPAKEESINTILEMSRHKDGNCRCLCVTGCLSQRYKEQLYEELPEVDIFWGVRDYDKFALKLAEFFKLPPCNILNAPRVLTTPSYSAYLRISDGCLNRCTYCAIPLIRGDMVSVPFDKIIKEATRLATLGVTEINVIAQDTTAYGKDLYNALRLPELLNAITEIKGIRMVRLLYTYPDTVTDELIDTIAANDKIANYIDIPIQHINDELLFAMHRRGTSSDIKRIFKKIRATSPDFIIRTSIIVGFPGETDAAFEELIDFLREYPVNRLGAFTYSPEDDTPAAKMPVQIDERIKQMRLNTLMRVQADVSKTLNERRVGETALVLVENVGKGYLSGRSYADAPDVDGHVIVRGDVSGITVGDYVKVKLTEALEYDMYGELI